MNNRGAKNEQKHLPIFPKKHWRILNHKQISEFVKNTLATNKELKSWDSILDSANHKKRVSNENDNPIKKNLNSKNCEFLSEFREISLKSQKKGKKCISKTKFRRKK